MKQIYVKFTINKTYTLEKSFIIFFIYLYSWNVQQTILL